MENLKYRFNAPKLELEFLAEDGSVARTIPLGKALRRSILRAGSGEDGTAIIVVERPYIQNHAIEASIAESEAALVEAFRKHLGASRPHGQVSFPGSRNPGGVYSDLFGGIKVGEYSGQAS